MAKLETQLTRESGLTELGPPAPPTPPAPPVAKVKDWDAGGRTKSDDDDDDDDSASKKGASNDDHTNINLPGVHISTNGDKADVSLPGISIQANGDNAEVHAGLWGHSATIESRDGRSTIRVGHADPSGVDSTLIVTTDNPGPTGYRAIGYVAKGPPAGPLVIATFKAKSGDRSEHDLAGNGLKKLVNLNVHQGFGWFSDAAADGDKDAKP